MVLQLIVRGNAPTSTEALNVWNFDDSAPSATTAAALQSAYEGFAPILSDDATFDLDPVGRVLDDATGLLLGFEAVSWSAPVEGTGVGLRGPDASCALISWQTATIVGGRALRGRTYLPYPSLSVLGEGQITGGGLTAFQAAVDNAESDFGPGGLVIWHRPVGGAGGVAGPVVAGVARPEYGVQRRRRD